MKIHQTLNRILYGLHHYYPIADGYTIRSHYILEYIEKQYQVQTIRLKDKAFSSSIPFFKQHLQRKNFERGFRKAVEHFDPQIIHVNSPWEVGLPAIDIAATFEIPMIYEVRGFWEETKVAQKELEPNSPKYKSLKEKETEVMYHADHVIAISEGIRQEIGHRGIDIEKISVIPNGIDLDKFNFIQKDEQSLRLVQKYNLENAKVIGYIGSIRQLEGLHLVIDHLSEIIRAIPETKMLIVGDGPDLEGLKNFTRQKALEDTVIFVGKVEHSLIREYYSVMNLILLPRISQYANEVVSPLKILEPMALGKLVLGSDVGGIQEIIENGVNGFLFTKDDPKNFVTKCITLLQRDHLREKVTRSARKWVEQNRSWQQLLKNYDEIYEMVMRKYYVDNIA